MKELWLNSKSDLVSFSASVQESLDKSDVNFLTLPDNGIAEICEEGLLACISKGCSLEIVNIKNGQRNSAFSFELQSSQLLVSCFCSYQSKYLIALKPRDEAQKKGILCLYDPGISRVVKSIKLFVVPTSICLIKEFGGAGYKSNFISDVFKCFFGMVAVGTSCGHVYIIDLRNDDKEEYFTMSNPSSLLVTNAATAANISELRDKAKSSEKHCCIDLSSNFCSHNSFKYMDAEQRILRMYDSGMFSVTALNYLQQAASLVVGYQFGCFHIFSMETLQLTHSSQVGSISIPVTNFTFQEPDDDPRSCFYLWVGRQPSPTEDTEINNVPTTLSLYQLVYEDKEVKPGYGNFYKNLECVIKRFNHQLTSDVHHLVDSHSAGSRIICLKTLAKNQTGFPSNTSEEGFSGSDSTLCYVVWETPSAEKDMTCHLGVFDINQWYQKQLPGSIRDAMYGRMEAVCPFFAFYSLSDIAEEFLPNGILDVWVNGNSVSNFQSVVFPQSEHFYWPSSAMFSATCVTESSSIDIEILGLQRQIIADVRKSGTDSFVDAQEVVQNCWMAGLLQNTIDITRAIDDKRNADAVLSIYLEHDGINFISSCVKKWSHGSITHAGHSMKMIYDWAWSQVVHVKKSLDQLYVPLFQSLTEKLEPEHSDRLKRVSIDLHLLAEVFRELQRADALSVADGREELETREKVVSYLDTYCGILLLLVDIDLLPEQTNGFSNNNGEQQSVLGRIRYPYKVLSDYYSFRRDQQQKSDHKKPEESLCLFIDLMCKQFLKPKDTATSDDFDMADTCSMQQYPPKTLEIMCRLFVENFCEDGIQIMIFYYWVLDICECFEQLQSSQVSKKFKNAALNLTVDKALLVESLWLLDHKLYKDATEHLSLIESKISSRYYTHIVRTLHQVDQLKLLVTFCSCKEPVDCSSFDELKFLIQVFLRLKLFDNAYRLQSSYGNQSKKSLLFNYFFEQCKENKLLGKLVSLALTSDEEELLKRILKRTSGNQDYLLVYYLERGYYSDAYNLTKEIRNSAKWRRLRSTLLTTEHLEERKVKMMLLDQLETKGLLVDGFIQTVPSIEQKKLSLKETKDMQNASGRKTNRRQPLSTMYRRDRVAQKDISNQSTDILSTLYDHDLSTDLLDTTSFLECVGGNQRRRKSPLFDGELTSPKKKQKVPSIPEATTATTYAATSEPNRLGGRNRKDLFQGKDAFLLLVTPPAIRRVKHVNVPNTGNEERLKTPQSILKSRGASRISQTDPPKQLTVSTDIPSRKIRFIGLSPTSPLSPSNENLAPKDPLLKDRTQHHLSFDDDDDDDDKPSPIKESEEHILTKLDKDPLQVRISGDSPVQQAQRSLTSADVDSIILELSRDEEGMNQSSVFEEESFPSTSITEEQTTSSRDVSSSGAFAEEDNNSSANSSPVHKKPDIHISSDDSSQILQYASAESSLTINQDTSDLCTTDSDVKSIVLSQQDFTICPPGITRVCLQTEMPLTGHSKESDDDIVSDTSIARQSAEEFENVDYVIVDENEYVEADVILDELDDNKNNHHASYFDDIGDHQKEEEEEDYGMEQYEDSGNTESSRRIGDAGSRENEEDFEMYQEENIESESNNGTNEDMVRDTEEPSDQEAVDTFHENVIFTDNETVDAAVTSQQRNEEVEFLNLDQSRVVPILSDSNQQVIENKEDLEMADSFSEQGSNYGDKPKLFVDDSIPVSSTFVENDSFSEYAIDESITGLTDYIKSSQPPIILEDLININTANDSIVTESFGPNESVSAALNESLNTTTNTRRRSRRPKIPTRDSLSSDRMVTRSALKKVIEEGIASVPEESFNPEDVNISNVSKLESSTQQPSTQAESSSLSEADHIAKSVRTSTCKKTATQEKTTDSIITAQQSKPPVASTRITRGGKITNSLRKSPSRRRPTKAESLISMPLVREEELEDDNGNVSNLTKVAERSHTKPSTNDNDQVASLSHRLSGDRLDTSHDVEETSTSKKTRPQRKEKGPRKESDDDIVSDTSIARQSAEEFENVDYVIVDENEYVDADVIPDELDDIKNNQFDDIGDHQKEEEDYEMVQYEDPGNTESSRRIGDAGSRENEEDFEMYQEENIESESNNGTNEDIVRDSEEPSDQEAVDTFHENVIFTDNEIVDAAVTSQQRNEEVEFLNQNQSRVVPILSDSNQQVIENKEDLEMADSFSEQGSNYGDKPKLFVDDNIPVSSTFVENDSFIDESTTGLTDYIKSSQPPILLENLINVNTANDSIVTESFGPNESVSAALNESLDTTTNTRRRSRRPKTPTRDSLSSERMVTRSALKKVIEEGITSVPEESFNPEDVNISNVSKLESSTQQPSTQQPSTQAESSSLSEADHITKSVRTSTYKKTATQEKTTDSIITAQQSKPPIASTKITRGGKITNALRKSPSRRRPTKAESLISMPLVREKVLEDDNGNVSNLTDVGDRSYMKSSMSDSNLASLSRRQSGVHTSLDVGETSTSRKTRLQRKEKEKTDTKPEGILSFEKEGPSNDPVNVSSITTPARSSQRSSSKRASLAITDLSVTRKSSRSKNTT